MVTAERTDFPIAWRQAEDAEALWVWDGMHCPRSYSPLSIDFSESMFRNLAAIEGREDRPEDRFYPNGYLYTRQNLANLQAPPTDRVEKSLRVRRDWQRSFLPRVRSGAVAVRTAAYDQMSDAEARQGLVRALEKSGYAFGLTLAVVGPMFSCAEQLIEFCEEELGSDGAQLAAAMMQGYSNASAKAGAALWQVAMQARERGLEAELLRRSDDEALAAVASHQGGLAFVAAFDAYLERFGWRSPEWFELSLPTWREDPRPALQAIRQYLSGEAESPLAALARAARGRKAALRESLSRLKDSDKRDELRRLYGIASQFVPVSESRAMWQLSLGGGLRQAALGVGRRLVEAGDLAEPERIFYLKAAEIASGEGRADWDAIAEKRRAEREHWMKIVPPMRLGSMPALPPAPDGGPTKLPLGARLVSGWGVTPSVDPALLQGTGASPGVATGTAKVLESVDEADKVAAGDILVCRFTTPAWTPLFSRVAAIVADSGGLLSHCAIVAREYAIPCVVGVRVGTRRIRDGMRLTVDGSQGIVRFDG